MKKDSLYLDTSILSALAPYRKEIKEAELYNTINLVKLRLEPWPRPGIGV